MFSIEGTTGLIHAHFKNPFELANARVELKDKQRLPQEQQLHQRRLEAAATSQVASSQFRNPRTSGYAPGRADPSNSGNGR